MRQWHDSEKPTDFSVAYDKGYFDLCAYYLVSSGALEPVCPESKKIISMANKVSYAKIKKQMSECFKHCIVMSNEYNETIFVPVDDPSLDYFVPVETWETYGYKSLGQFGKKS